MKSSFSILFVAATFALLSNCGSNKQGDSTEIHDGHTDSQMHSSSASADANGSKPAFAADAEFQEQLASVFTAYVALKDALVSSNVNKVSAEAVATKQSLAKTDMKLLSGAAHNDWMNYLGAMETSLKEMENSADIESQRIAFSILSDNLYKSIKAYGLGGATAYYEFCPMALNNKGGFWLSREEEIRNPYFGEKMMTCGEVRETLH
ncbi:MAG: DUF3347 domain-containing protein [Cyclobacteriaceae bacterium]|nr:DUF3347 domain-containing protein [Cyclobacteriaceae bacterium]MDH4295386.1 DUF3347 domain-containing protein [Cyclobacteriaceae bacterium]MDH5249626.1 DUF3347 domain-containing protein [Cyclobacteriaceae bacterium]